MDVLWMQNFLGLAQCEPQPCSSSANRPLHYDDFEGDNDALFEFSCPFCYVEYDIGSLCSHLEEDHRFESKSVICPVCAAKAGTDVVGHITNQHGHLFKMQRRRRARKPSSSSSASLSLDPLLSSLLSGLSIQESETISGIPGIEAVTKGPLSTDQRLPSIMNALHSLLHARRVLMHRKEIEVTLLCWILKKRPSCLQVLTGEDKI